MPAAPTLTPTRRLADRLLADVGGVDQLIADKRADGASWRAIALAIRDLTAGEVDVTDETVRRWGSEQTPAPTAA